MILNQEVAPLEVKIIYFFYISLSISPEKNPGHNYANFTKYIASTSIKQAK